MFDNSESVQGTPVKSSQTQDLENPRISRSHRLHRGHFVYISFIITGSPDLSETRISLFDKKWGQSTRSFQLLVIYPKAYYIPPTPGAKALERTFDLHYFAYRSFEGLLR